MGKRFTALAFIVFFTTVAAQGGQTRADILDSYVKGILPYKALLTAFLKEMPKGADLHNHCEGAVYAETMIAYALTREPPLYFDLDSGAFADPGIIPENHIAPEEIRGNFIALSAVLDSFSVRHAKLRGVSGHDHFFSTFGRFVSAMPPTEMIATETFTRIAAQNIRHVETMIPVSPTVPVVSEAEDGEKREEEVSREGDLPVDWRLVYSDPAERSKAFAEAARREIETYEDARKRRLSELSLDEDHISAGYILYLNRLVDLETFEEYLNDFIAAWNADIPGLVGFTMVAPEDAWASRNNFREQFKLLDRYLRDDANWRGGIRPKFNWHAGELTLELNPYECLRDRIGETIWMGHADRIGHGTSVAWEDNCYELLLDMRNRGICIEICPSSNETILGVTGDDHPFYLYRSAGVAMTIATDDEGVNRSNLTNEYVKAAQSFNLGYNDLKELSRNSLEYSFLPGESLFIDHDYARCKNPLPKDSKKAEMQAKLESDFAAFERFMTDRVLKDILIGG